MESIHTRLISIFNKFFPESNQTILLILKPRIMLITNFRVTVTKNGDGAISFTKNKINYKVFISKNNLEIKETFDKYYSQLKSFKNRHYAIAKWIIRDIRAKGYYFKAYAGNNRNIRPIKHNEAVKLSSKELYEQQILENMHRMYLEKEVSDFERLIH